MARIPAREPIGSGSREAACVQRTVRRFDGETGAFIERPDAIVQEACLAVLVDGAPFLQTTCSPWDVEELVVGALFMAGAIERAGDLTDLDVDLAAGVASARLAPAARAARGDAELRRVREGAAGPECAEARPHAAVRGPVLAAAEVNRRIELLEDRSLLFRRTGGVHSAVLSDERGAAAWFEDIGRHSALDKLAGWCLLNGVGVADKVLLFTGRVPREIIVRAIRLGCPVVVSPGAPTDLSIRLAEDGGVTLVGFGKGGSFNVYSHPERIVL